MSDIAKYEGKATLYIPPLDLKGYNKIEIALYEVKIENDRGITIIYKQIRRKRLEYINIPHNASFIILEDTGHPEVEGQYKVTVTETLTAKEAIFPAFSEEWIINFLKFINKYINQSKPNILFDGRNIDLELDESENPTIRDEGDKISVNSNPKEGELVEDVLLEGSMHEVLVSVYERNQIARRICIEHYGPTCVICGLNFGEKYGDIVRNFIHVHHITPLSVSSP